MRDKVTQSPVVGCGQLTQQIFDLQKDSAHLGAWCSFLSRLGTRRFISFFCYHSLTLFSQANKVVIESILDQWFWQLLEIILQWVLCFRLKKYDLAMKTNETINIDMNVINFGLLMHLICSYFRAEMFVQNHFNLKLPNSDRVLDHFPWEKW